MRFDYKHEQELLCRQISQRQLKAMGNYKRGKACWFGAHGLFGGEYMQFNIIASFFLNVGRKIGALEDVPVLRAIYENSKIIVAPFVRSALGVRTKEIGGNRA